MYPTDFHLHTNYSRDSSERLEDVCKKAIELGLKEIAITDHVDIIPWKTYDWEVDLDERKAHIEKMQKRLGGKLIVRNGIELGQPQYNPKEYKKFLKNHDFDFIIGSVHDVAAYTERKTGNGERPDGRQIYDWYLDSLIELAENYDFDVMGHLTFLLRFIDRKTREQIRMEDFEEKFRHLFRILVEKGKGIEVNASGLLKEMQDTLPPQKVVGWYRECGGEIITYGSDAHQTGNIGYGREMVYEMLRDLGFRYIMTFEKRTAKEHSL